MQQLEAILFTQLNEAIDQFFLQTVKLVAALGKLPALTDLPARSTERTPPRIVTLAYRRYFPEV